MALFQIRGFWCQSTVRNLILVIGIFGIFTCLMMFSNDMFGFEGTHPRQTHRGKPRTASTAKAKQNPAKFSSSSEDWLQKQREQMQNIKDVCKRRGISHLDVVDLTVKIMEPQRQESFVVDEVHKVIYCDIPKAASSSWRALILGFRGINVTSLPFPVKQLNYLKDYPVQDIMDKLRNYRLFTMVRHPLTRLYSAYRNKFIAFSKPDWKLITSAFLERIKQAYGQSALSGPIIHPEDNRYPNVIRTTTFAALARYVSDPNITDALKRDKHWDHLNNLCYFCSFDYQFIGKQENLREDSKHIVQLLFGIDREFPFINDHGRTDLSQVLEELPSDIKKALEKHYALDFEMFGYS